MAGCDRACNWCDFSPTSTEKIPYFLQIRLSLQIALFIRANILIPTLKISLIARMVLFASPSTPSPKDPLSSFAHSSQY
jgi:hypothetical protein